MDAAPPVIARALVLLLACTTPAAGQAVLKGFVREDSTLRPLADVEVIVEGASRPYRTNAAGGYTVWDLSPGRRLVQLRRLGFDPIEERVDLVEGTQDRVFYLKRAVQTLDTVVARGPAPRGIGREAFEERRKLGFGRFFDSTMLRKNDHRKLIDIVRDAGIRVVIPPLCYKPGSPAPPYCDVSARKQVALSVAGTPCALKVIQDGVTMYRGPNSGPIEWEDTFDLNGAMISTYESVEVYRRPAEVPMEFGGGGFNCGAIVLWTRRRR